MPQPLSLRVLDTIRRHRMIQPGQRVIVGVSGGADSVALLLLLEELRQALPTKLIVAHFNHRLRGEAADVDERFVAELARSHELECLVRREDVAEYARRAGTNLEEEARKRRYAFFRDAMRDRGASLAATGHTADDQAETVLARLARGTGLRGLAAIHPVLGPVVRPLLELRRAELRDFLCARRQPWCEDETNRDAQRLRARTRSLLPVLQAECGENLVTNLAQLAEQARADEALIRALVEERFREIVGRREGVLSLAASDLIRPWAALSTAGASRALASRLVRRAVEEVQGDLRRLTADHVERVLRLAREGTSGDRLELPAGFVVERALGRVLFLARGQRKHGSAGALVYCCLADPWRGGEVVVPLAETGKRVRLKLIDWPAAGSETYPEAGVLDADRLDPPLQVRNWLPGDAYRPSGRRRVLKLKRLLLERRIAGRDRLEWPVLTSAGQPVWASGLAVAADWAAGPQTRQALLVKEELSEAAADR
ncbi:MAG TPA: tRNA lysidine(34) synthetase TilS [Candidatus Acidoferrales bacterium]|nr:tRNA lysidine(34) synthetase TilS [Candidatus Acidoferrales bacterium]